MGMVRFLIVALVVYPLWGGIVLVIWPLVYVIDLVTGEKHRLTDNLIMPLAWAAQWVAGKK